MPGRAWPDASVSMPLGWCFALSGGCLLSLLACLSLLSCGWVSGVVGWLAVGRSGSGPLGSGLFSWRSPWSAAALPPGSVAWPLPGSGRGVALGGSLFFSFLVGLVVVVPSSLSFVGLVVVVPSCLFFGKETWLLPCWWACCCRGLLWCASVGFVERVLG